MVAIAFSIQIGATMISLPTEIESGAGGPTVLHSLVTEDQPSLLFDVNAQCMRVEMIHFCTFWMVSFVPEN